MQFTTACFHPSLPIRLAVLFLLAYPFVVWLLSTYRTAVGPIAASAVPLALTPVLVGAGIGWLGITHLLESLAIAGGGRASRAAGVSEIFVIVAFSSAIAGLVAGIAWFRDAIRQSRLQAPFESHEERQPSERMKALAAILTALALAAVVGQVVIARRTVYNASAPAPVSPTFAAVIALVVLFAGITALAWLVASRRTSAAQFYRHRRVLALSCTIVSIALCYAAWHLADEFRSIAVFG